MTTVSFRTDKDKQPLTITIEPAEMQRLAKQWHYRLRSRQRWIADQKLWPTIEELAVKDLAAIGLNEPQLEAIAVGSIVEVSINQDPLRADSSTDPASEPEWEARLMPWEYLLTAGTSKYRDEPLVVIRHLKTADSPKARARGKEKRRAAFLQSEPGELRGKYSFQIEKEAIRSYLGDAVDWKDFPANPRLDQIREHVREHAPSIVHVSGIDNFQGTVLLKEHTPVTEIHDGMFLKDSVGKAFQCPAMLVAESITAGKPKPEIVSFNMFNSSARLAAFSVGLGARAAIGFQDVVDDRLAEIFFVNFYLNLRQWKWCILDAYRQTMRELRCYRDKLRGTGIVLWTRESIFKESGKQSPSTKKPRSQSAQAVPASSEWIKFTIKPLDTLNYSILHNSRTPLFERFSVYKFKPLQHPEIDVEVELQMGSDRFPFRHTFEMRDHVLDLSDQITVGLTSEMVRSLREGVRATLFVLITSGRQRLFHKTFRVTLLAVDEWRNDDSNRIWLPSFVLPRDRAVLEIIIGAQGYLKAIRDCAFAGFDGYQGSDRQMVNSQVQAIWHGLVHDFRLNYINPPPTFTFSSQRLRTPDEIIRGSRGTCIDLALLIAACLEFINIWPVIFIIEGHAFPGFWISEEGRNEFRVAATVAESTSGATEAFAQRFPWEFGKSRHREILEAVTKGHLIPVESTLLTSGGGFRQAIAEGTKNLQDKSVFNTMLEIGLARDDDVTPLPLATEADRWPAKS